MNLFFAIMAAWRAYTAAPSFAPPTSKLLRWVPPWVQWPLRALVLHPAWYFNVAMSGVAGAQPD